MFHLVHWPQCIKHLQFITLACLKYLQSNPLLQPRQLSLFQHVFNAGSLGRQKEDKNHCSLYHATVNYFKVIENEGQSKRLSESKCRAHHQKKEQD